MGTKPEYLKVYILNSQVVFEGSINTKHPLESDTELVTIILSDGTNINFEHHSKFDCWFVKHSRKVTDKQIEVVKEVEYGGSDEFVVKYAIATATIAAYPGNSKIVTYGTPELSKDQENIYITLVNYLNFRGVICVNEMQNDLKRIITGTYKKG